MNTQPKFGTRKPNRTESKMAARLSAKKTPHATNTAERTAATQNTTGSIPGLAGLCISIYPFPGSTTPHLSLFLAVGAGTVAHSATCFNNIIEFRVERQRRTARA